MLVKIYVYIDSVTNNFISGRYYKNNIRSPNLNQKANDLIYSWKMEPYLLEKRMSSWWRHQKMRNAFMLNPTFQSKVLCISNFSAKFQLDWVKDGETTAM